MVNITHPLDNLGALEAETYYITIPRGSVNPAPPDSSPESAFSAFACKGSAIKTKKHLLLTPQQS